MLTNILKFLFGTRNARVLAKMWPAVHRINAIEESYQALAETELQAKTAEFKARLVEASTEARDKYAC